MTGACSGRHVISNHNNGRHMKGPHEANDITALHPYFGGSNFPAWIEFFPAVRIIILSIGLEYLQILCHLSQEQHNKVLWGV